MKIAVTGVGAVSALGRGAGVLFDALCERRDALSHAPLWDGRGPAAMLPGGEQRLSSELALVAAREALAGFDGLAGLAVVGATTSADMRAAEPAWQALARGEAPDPERFVWPQLCHQPTQRVAAALGAGGLRLSLSTACTSGACAVGVAADLLRAGRAPAVLAFGADALCDTTVHGFGSLGLYDPEPCQPMSAGRKGLNLGEGAGALLLEPLEAALARGVRPLALIGGYGNACDAYRLTAPRPGGCGRRGRHPRRPGHARPRDGRLGLGPRHGHAVERRHRSPGAGPRAAPRLGLGAQGSHRPHAGRRGRPGGGGHGAGGGARAPAAGFGQVRVRLPHAAPAAGPDGSAPGGRPVRQLRLRRARHRPAGAAVGAVIRIAASTIAVPGGPEGLLEDLLAGRRREGRAPEPARPAAVDAGSWRRMSRLTRLVVATAGPLLAGRSDLDRLPVVWGNGLGELAPIARFLERLYGEGPQAASPLAFQNSVTNAPVGHLSIGLGLRGPSETLSAGGASGGMALLRAVDLLRLGVHDAVLVVAGDDLNEVVERAFGGLPSPPSTGEAMAALLLTRGGTGPVIEVEAGIVPLAGAPVLARGWPLPGEGMLQPVPGAVAPEACLGLVPAMGAALVAALAQARRAGSVVEQDGPFALTACVLEAP
ncbi:MAG: beta-ketoacyl synthase N-terminal-like domain-containing protein [Pseudomonadota bacterium]